MDIPIDYTLNYTVYGEMISKLDAISYLTDPAPDTQTMQVFVGVGEDASASSKLTSASRTLFRSGKSTTTARAGGLYPSRTPSKL